MILPVEHRIDSNLTEERMPNIRNSQSAWQPVEGDQDLSYLMRYDFQCLSWDRDAATIDFVLRFGADGGHCPRHRHLASTTVLVVDGEQHLDEILEDGSTVHKMRACGEYHRSTGPDARPHMERGGPDGATVFYSCHAPDGRLFELLSDDLEVTHVVTIDNMISAWESHLASVASVTQTES